MNYELIRSIHDIDTKKISIRDINKRYIDHQGNRYATRFNIQTRQVEIVHLASSKSEAIALRKKILENKKKEKLKKPGNKNDLSINYDSDELYSSSNSIYDVSPLTSKNNQPSEDSESSQPNHLTEDKSGASFYDPYEDDYHYRKPIDTFGEENQPVIEKNIFNESRYLEDVYSDLEKTRDRLSAMINIFKKTRLFEIHKTDEVFDILRQLDAESRQLVEKTINLFKEINYYPRPLSYYISKMTDEKKNILEKLTNDETRMEYIKRWELQDAIGTTYSRLLNVNTNLIRIIHDIPEEVLSAMERKQKQYVDNAISSCQLLIDESNRMLTRLNIWKKHTPDS